jgi:dTDP-4-amino-4,6-dideoxygalactose transaminase
MYYLLMPSIDLRTCFIEHLAKHGIKAVFHYLPLHLSSFAERQQLGAWSRDRKAECPVTTDVSDQLVRLPFYTDLSTEEHDRVLSAIKSFPR